MEAISREDAFALLRSEAAQRYGEDASLLEDSLAQLAKDMEAISAVVIPDWMLGELG